MSSVPTPVKEEEVYYSETGYDLTDVSLDLNTVLSGQRVSQMTKTFVDVDALQKLLEEKEKDLELAARIGQQLLEQNQQLRERVTSLEADNKENVESITQLKHELNFKSQLLEIYNDSQDSAEPSKAGTPVLDSIGAVASVLERRLQLLEDENKVLREEACRMAEDVEKTEAEEKYLVDDAISRLGEANRTLTHVSDELDRKSQEVKNQADEIAKLEEELSTFQQANRELVDENNQLRQAFEALSHNQNHLSTEIIDLKENYIEVVSILKETQEQLREAQKQKDEGADVVTVFDSLAYEIDSSVARHRKASDYFRRTFDTVRMANSKLSEPTSSTSLVSTNSGLPSFDSSSSNELIGSSNFNSLVLESGLGSSLCYSPAGSSTPGGSWRFPEKLQIVKPLEGSSTLQIWSSLATPHLGTLLEKRPGVQTRVERPIDGVGANQHLPLTSEPHTFIVGTPAVFTFVTTSSLRDMATTTFSTNMSSAASTCSLSSLQSGHSDRHSPVPHTTPVSSRGSNSPQVTKASYYASGDYLKMGETPQNSPLDGNSRPISPAFKGGGDSNSSSKRTLKTLYAVYDTLCSKIGGLGNVPKSVIDFAPQLPQNRNGSTRNDSSIVRRRLQPPPKPGTGALDRILLEPD